MLTKLQNLRHFFVQLGLIRRRLKENKSDKDLLIIGNAPSSSALNTDKIIKELHEKKIEIIVLNGFFSQDKISLPDIEGINFFYLDTQIKNYVKMKNDEIISQLNKDARKIDDALRRKAFMSYVSDSILDDILSIKTALKRVQTKVFLHPKFHFKYATEKIYLLRGYKIFIFFNYLLSLFSQRIFFGELFGQNVVGYAIYYGLEVNFRNIYVIGHAERFDYRVDEKWKIKYNHFYSEKDNWHDRDEPLKEFGYSYLKARIFEYKLPARVQRKVKFLGTNHDHYALMGSKHENDRFLN